MFKYIVKNTDYVIGLFHHDPGFNISINNTNMVMYALPDGNNASFKFFINSNINEDDIDLKALNQKRPYFDYISSICHINHYCGKTHEEFLLKILKFGGNNKNNSTHHTDKQYREEYLLYEDDFKNMRDLYKLYFIDNINNIRED